MIQSSHRWLRGPLLAAVLWCCVAGAAMAQAAWPTRPIKLLVPYPPGGSTDIISRLVGQGLSAQLGQPVVIENRGGANGSVAANYFAGTAPDDYAFMVTSLPMLAVNQFLFKKLGYDPETAFVPIGLMAQTPNVIVVQPSLQVNTLKEFIARAKSAATPLAYSSSGIGSSGHLLNELFKTTVGAQFIHLPYRGNGPAMAALLGGEVQFTTDNLPQLLPQIRSGKLKALAVTSSRRWFQLPDVPTVAETGYPNLASSAWFGIVTRPGVSPQVIARMNTELNKLLKQPEFIAKLHEVSFEPMPGSPQDLNLAAQHERGIWKKVIEASGATAD